MGGRGGMSQDPFFRKLDMAERGWEEEATEGGKPVFKTCRKCGYTEPNYDMGDGLCEKCREIGRLNDRIKALEELVERYKKAGNLIKAGHITEAEFKAVYDENPALKARIKALETALEEIRGLYYGDTPAGGDTETLNRIDEIAERAMGKGGGDAEEKPTSD